MQWYDLLVDGYGRVPDFLAGVLEGLADDELHRQPRPDCNSIAWLAWHLTRQHDAQVADLMGADQLWIKDGWHERFDRPADPRDVGFGHTSEQVAAFRAPDTRTLVDYQKAVTERTKTYLRSLSATDLDRVIDRHWNPPVTMGVRLISILEDSMLHAGQAAYLRGLIQGKGWQPY